MRGIVKNGGDRFRRMLPYGLALGLVLATTGQAAFQDAPSLMDRAGVSAERWQAMLVAEPFGSVHPPSRDLPVMTSGMVLEQPVGIQFIDPSTGETVMLGPDSDPATITGSIGPRAGEGTAQPVVARDGKGDLLMSRAGLSQKLSLDEENGVLIRRPRLLMTPPDEEVPLSSFMQPEEETSAPIQLASLSFDHFVARQALLETPLQAFERRQIEQAELGRDLQCLATAVYFEARGEPERGQRAVAQVVLNRVADHRYPDSVCEVVYQNQHRRNACQFSFACDGKPERVRDQSSWALAMTVAREAVMDQYFLDEIGGSTHYHANYVNPRWSRALRKMDRVGRHIFYKLRPGQT